jgi:thioesterase domain-containing protein/acyl carrier protein
LVAYYTGEPNIGAEALRKHALARLPEYMAPAAYVNLERFPLTANGKLDRRALPPPEGVALENNRSYVAPRTPTEEALARIWCEVLGVNHVGVLDSFFELGGDSLMAVRLIGKVNRTLNVSLGVAALFQAPAVEQFARVFNDASRPTYPAGIVEIRAGNVGCPVFCLPGLGSTAFQIHMLSARLDTFRPVLGIELHDLGVEPSVLRSMEDLAEAVLQRMRQVQPVGPYTILGYSFGGTLAVEVARQLMAMDQALESVVILDSYVPDLLRSPEGLRKLAVHLRIIRRLDYKETFTYFRSRIQSRLFPRTLPKDEIERRIFETSKDCLDAFRAHRPKVFPGRIVLFKAGIIGDWLVVTDPSGTNGWSDICKDGVDIIPLACGHMDVFKEPNITVLAGLISDLLNARIGRNA